MSRRDNYFAKMKTQLDEVNAQISALEDKATVLKNDLRETYDQELTKVHEHAKRAHDKLAEIKVASEKTWHEMVSDMERLRNDVINGYGSLKARL